MHRFKKGDTVIIKTTVEYLMDLNEYHGCEVDGEHLGNDVSVVATVVETKRESIKPYGCTKRVGWVRTNKSNWIPTNIVFKPIIMLGGERDGYYI